MKKLLLFFFISPFLFAQFSSGDYDLVKNNFFRNYDKNLIKDYLFSGVSDSVKAGLLSVSHSEDTSWVKEIIKLDFDKFGDYISFSLGQLGQSQTSSEYLFDKIQNGADNKFIRECFEAYGLTADSSSILSLLELTETSANSSLHGLPYAVNNFNSRSPIPQKEKFINYLISEIKESDSNERIFDAVFVLSRLGGSTDANDLLAELLNRDTISNSIKYYALNNFRRTSYFPDDYHLFTSLINDEDPRIRTEAARTLCFYEFRNIEILKEYLILLKDINPNVSRQAAISINNINIEEELKEKLYQLIYEILDHDNITDNTRGELFINYCRFYSDEYLELIDEFENSVKPEFIYRVLSENVSKPLKNFRYILSSIADTTEIDFLNFTQAALPLQDSLRGNDEYLHFVLSILNSSSPIGSALTAYTLDSAIVAENVNLLQQILLEQAFKYYNNADYTESLRAFHDLAGKISQDFALELLNMYKTSTVKWTAAFARRLLNEKIDKEKSKDIDFDKLWESAFQFYKASVNTNKGSFTIEFTPEYSPISVGNFCYLVSQKYYDNVIFHRVVPNFVIQTGDPTGTGWSGPGYEIVSEFSLQPYLEGAVGMASSGKDTEGSQWFVMHSNFPHLNWRYTNFGRVFEGMDTVNIIDQKDFILNIELIK